MLEALISLFGLALSFVFGCTDKPWYYIFVSIVISWVLLFIVNPLGFIAAYAVVFGLSALAPAFRSVFAIIFLIAIGINIVLHLIAWAVGSFLKGVVEK
jgi:hypothetical protein